MRRIDELGPVRLLMRDHCVGTSRWAVVGRVRSNPFDRAAAVATRLHLVGRRPGRRDALPPSRAREVLASYCECVATAPDELMTIVVLTTAPAAPFVPQSVHGQSVAIIGVCYAGCVDKGEHAIARLRRSFVVAEGRSVSGRRGSLRPWRAPRDRPASGRAC
jgi:hypothetical protein